MKISKAAKILGKTRRTLQNWMERTELIPFFSKDSGKDLSEDDLFTLNTIRVLRDDEGLEWEDIAKRMSEGYRAAELPANSLIVDTGTAPVAYLGKQASLQQQNRELAIQLEQKESELKVLRGEMDELRTEQQRQLMETRSYYEEKLMSLQERLLREIGELRQRLGKYEQTE